MNSEWQLIEAHPVNVFPEAGSSRGEQRLLYSRRLGIKVGEVCVWPDGDIRGRCASVAAFHGDAIADWGVTHWMPLPDPPKEQS